MISVLLPTRNRFELCKRSIHTLYDKAALEHSFEVLLGTDVDDPAPYHTLPGAVFQFERRGYGMLHEYYNALASKTNGDWLFLWNDDCRMLAEGWDKTILSYDGQFVVLAPFLYRLHRKTGKHIRQPKSGRTLFPIIPMEMFNLLGRVSGHSASDSWLEVVGTGAGIFHPIVMDIFQDRPDDEITTVRSMPHIPFASKVNQRDMSKDTKRIREYLDR